MANPVIIGNVEIRQGDCLDVLRSMPDESVNCVVTSPPYWGLRDYGVDGQLGLEPTIDLYVSKMVEILGEVRRVLRSDGTFWLNLGDSYAANRGYQVTDSKHIDVGNNQGSSVPAGLKPKDLCMIPARVALALQAEGWWLRSEIIWAKPNPMPESVTDRPTSSHEKIYLLSKSQTYFYDADAVKTPAKYENLPGMDESGFKDPRNFNGKHKNGYNTDKQRGHSRRHEGFNDRWDAMPKAEQQSMGANLRNVWNIATAPFADAHFATFPEKLVVPCIKAGCPEGGIVLDPFGGSGTVGVVAHKLNRKALLIELNPDYIEISRGRIESATQQGDFFIEQPPKAEQLTMEELA